MKITFLGTADGKPSAERYCSSTMIEAGGNLYFIDCGAPLIDILLRRGEDVSKVKTIFITHTHNDHMDGVIPIAALFSWHYRDYQMDIYMPEEKVIGLTKQLLAAQMGSLDEARVRFHEVTEALRYDDGTLKVTCVPTRHLAGQNRPSFSYIVEAEGKKALFTGDLSGHLTEKDFPVCKGVSFDLAVCEMAHFSAEEVKPYLKELDTKKLLFNHVFPLAKLEDIKAMDGTLPCPVASVKDGDSVTV